MQYVEYIQNGEGTSRSTGWAIPLNYHPSITTDVRMVVKFDNVGNDGYLLVGSMNGDGNFFRLFSYMVRTMTFDCPNDSSARLSMAWNGLTEMEMGVDSNGAYYLRNLTTSRTVTATSVNQRLFESDFYLFNDGRGGDCFQGQKIYYIEIYENGTKVKDYRPAKDNNNVVCIYETIGHTYHYCEKTLIAGPTLSSIDATASKSSLSNTGETISIEVECENAWTVTGNTFLTLSSTGDTGSTTITATAPSYSGATARLDALTFTDSVTGDEAEITIRQKKYSLGQPIYLGGDEITELYLGEDAVSEAYLGDVLVYSSGPFVGLKITPKEISFNTVSLTSQVKVKSSESWSMTLPSWLSASQTTGDTGETIVTITATTQTAITSGSIVVTTANYSASATVNYYNVEFVNYVYENSGSYKQSSHLDTGIAHTASTMTVRLKYQAKGGNSDRMVGYKMGDTGCRGDANDFRIFGLYNGAFDYLYNRLPIGTINGNEQAYDLTMGDCFVYDNTNENYLIHQTETGVIPSPNCNIYCDLSFIKVNEVIIMDGNTVLFDGKAAKMGNDYGLFDTVGETFITSTDFVIVGDCDAECQCLNNGGQWINNECVYPTPPPTPPPTPTPASSMTLTIENMNPDMGGTASRNDAELISGGFTMALIIWDDDGGGTVSVDVQGSTAFTATISGNDLIVEGPFLNPQVINYSHTDSNMGACNSMTGTDSITFTNNSATTEFSTESHTDEACECAEQGGIWENGECTYPEDPCGGDPCCEQGISDPDECGCMMTGGWWDGSECHYD